MSTTILTAAQTLNIRDSKITQKHYPKLQWKGVYHLSKVMGILLRKA